MPLPVGLRRLLGHPRVWVVEWTHSSSTLARDTQGLLLARYREVDDRRWGRVEVSLWERAQA